MNTQGLNKLWQRLRGDDGMAEEVIARPVSGGGKVPSGCMGLEIGAGELRQWVGEGEMLRPQAGGVAWWVAPGPWRVQFAPQLAQAPEAGVQLELVLEPEHRALVRFLDGRDGLDRTELTALARELAGPWLLEPGMTAEEDEQARARLSDALLNGHGIRCIHLARVHLAEADTRAQCWSHIANQQAQQQGGLSDLLAAAEPGAERDSAPPSPAEAEDQAPPTNEAECADLAGLAVRLGISPARGRAVWWRPTVLDQEMRERMEKQLEGMAGQLRHWRRCHTAALAEEPWQNAHALEGQLRRMAQRLSVMPPLESPIRGLAHPYARRRAMAGLVREAQRHTESLQALCDRLELPDQDTPARLEEAQALLRLLEQALQQRQQEVIHG